MKRYYGFDHNVCPRQDIEKYGEKMVKEGKISRGTLETIRRMDNAHANSVEGFTVFVAGVVSLSSFYDITTPFHVSGLVSFWAE